MPRALYMAWTGTDVEFSLYWSKKTAGGDWANQTGRMLAISAH
jgi:hypothetical protein